MNLDLRSQTVHGGVVQCASDLVDEEDEMRVAHRDGGTGENVLRESHRHRRGRNGLSHVDGEASTAGGPHDNVAGKRRDDVLAAVEPSSVLFVQDETTD